MLSRFLFNRPQKSTQYLVSIISIVLVVAVGYTTYDFIGYQIIAFALLVTVSVLAMFYDIIPVLLSAFLSALLWDFLFIPPRYTFSVGSTQDRIMLVTYFIIALVNGVLTYKIRQVEKEARDKEEKANAVKFYNTLLNSLSHELRTPITTIIGASDNLQSENEKFSEENKTQLVHEISRAALRLNEQVENLLNMSRIESGLLKPKKDWCDVNEIIYAALKLAAINLRHHKVNVHIPENFPLFQLDFVWMEQALFNLVNNAGLYTPENTVISIKATTREDKLIITISDNGKGFPDNEINKVFDKFYRLQGAKSGGTGLGLSIVKGFVEAHDGIVWVENSVLGGARFTIEIPAKHSYPKLTEK
ncbi:MAG: DUF4118 domain-containing protein [Bacteroidetes bacterium]|nr:DUF4118 domain-containing protein [Bacteroidota bacterium]